jgi:hypothetical protein
MSSWSWSAAPFPMRTGREPRQPSKWSSVSSDRSDDPSTRYMILSGPDPWPACSVTLSSSQVPNAAASSV